MLKLKTILSRLGACDDAREWANGYDDLQDAWANCKRSDWMLWLLPQTTIDRTDHRLRLMACDFAEAVLAHVPAGEDRPRIAIEVSRRYASGGATAEELSAASDAASDAAGDAARAAAGDAASAAARAAAWAAARDAAWAAARDAARDAAGAAAGAAAWAAAIDAAGAAAGAAAWAAAIDAAWAGQADIIRKYFPECPPIKPELLKVTK